MKHIVATTLLAPLFLIGSVSAYANTACDGNAALTILSATDDGLFEETHGPEMSTTGICLAPSVEALIWIMQKVGFKDVKMIEPEEHHYEQHRFKKRVMIAGYV